MNSFGRFNNSHNAAALNSTNMTRPMWLPFVLWLALIRRMNQETVKLVWDKTPVSGRPEVYVNGQWRSVCVDKLPNENEVSADWPTVTCHQLGFVQGAESVNWLTNNKTLINATSLFYKNPKCDHVASKLSECPPRGGKCSSPQQVNLTCAANVRLSDGTTPGRGRAEYHDGHRWGTICDDVFARGGWPYVFCRELGYQGLPSEVSYAKDSEEISPGKGHISLKNPYCNYTNALTMRNCQTRKVSCDHQADVIVDCIEKPTTRVTTTSTTQVTTTTKLTTKMETTTATKYVINLSSKSAYDMKKEIIEEILDFDLPTEVPISLPPGVVESDERPTAHAIGGIGLGFFIMFLAIILLSDLPSFKRDICMMCRNLRHGYGALRNKRRAENVWNKRRAENV